MALESTEVTTGGEVRRPDAPKAFASDVAKIAGGTTIAQAIGIAASFLIARLYTPDAAGLAALFLSLVNTLVVVACLRYEFTIMLPKEDSEAINLLAVSLLINTGFSLALVPIMALYGSNIADFLNEPRLAPYLFLVPLMTFLMGAFQAVNYWNSRKRQFGRLATAQVSKAASTSATQIGLGYAGYGVGGSLIAGNIVGQAFATFTLGIRVWWEDRHLLRASLDRRVMRAKMSEYREFPIFDLWSGLINALSLQLPVFILSVYFTSAVVGHYSWGLLVLQLPISFIGQAISKVFYQRAASAFHQGIDALSSLSEQVVRRLIVIGVFPILVLSVVGQDLFIVFFGAQWAEAGLFSQILSFWILVIFIATPMNSILNVTKQMRIMLLFNVALIVVRSLSLIYGGMQDDVYLALALFSLTGGISWLVMFYWILRRVKVSVPRLLVTVWKELALATCLLLVLVAGKVLVGLEPLPVVLLSLACMAGYYAMAAQTDKEVRGLVMGIVRRFRR